MAAPEEMPSHFPADDETIDDGDVRYLRVFPRADQIARAADGDGYRPSSGALKSEEPLSVDWGAMCTPQETRHRDLSGSFHVAEIPAGLARSFGCRVVREPVPGNEAHVQIYGLHKRFDGPYTGALTPS